VLRVCSSLEEIRKAQGSLEAIEKILGLPDELRQYSEDIRSGKIKKEE
jgi:hypothetical protein